MPFTTLKPLLFELKNGASHILSDIHRYQDIQEKSYHIPVLTVLLAHDKLLGSIFYTDYAPPHFHNFEEG